MLYSSKYLVYSFLILHLLILNWAVHHNALVIYNYCVNEKECKHVLSVINEW